MKLYHYHIDYDRVVRLDIWEVVRAKHRDIHEIDNYGNDTIIKCYEVLNGSLERFFYEDVDYSIDKEKAKQGFIKRCKAEINTCLNRISSVTQQLKDYRQAILKAEDL